MNIFDEYLDEGHDQMDLLMEVLIPLMQDSGFIPKEEKKAEKVKVLK